MVSVSARLRGLRHSVLARLYAYNVFSLGVWYDEQESLAKFHIDKALEYGTNDPLIHSDVGESYLSFGYFDHARKHLELAMQLNPNDLSAMQNFGFFQAYSGDAENGLHWVEKASRLDPLLANSNWEQRAETLYLLREYEASLLALEEPLDPPPHTYSHIAACHAQLGQMEEAKEAVARFWSSCSEDVNFPRYAANHARLCKRQEDADNWMEGYRKAGLLD